MMAQRIEGYRIARLAWGTSSARPITIGFWTAHQRAGTYGVTVRNGSSNRSYAATYTVAGSSSPEYKTITIPGCTDGVWATDITVGMIIAFSMGAGPTLTAPSNNAWLVGNYTAANGQVNAVSATSDTLRIGGVIVLPGTQAPTAAQSPLIMRPYDQELVTCKRYWQLADPGMFGIVSAATTFFCSTTFSEMRAAPTATVVGAPYINAIYTNGGYLNLGGVTASFLNKSGGSISFNCSGATPSWVGMLYPNVTQGVITLDARL